MSKDPAFLFYPGDWLGGTITFTRHQKGAYIDLLVAQFNAGPLSLDDVKQILGVDFDLWEKKLEIKFKVDDQGRYFNQKLLFETEKRKSYTESRRNNIKSKHTSKHTIGHTTSRMENENENENSTVNGSKTEPESFTLFWDQYDKKRSKPKALKLWSNLSLKDRTAIFDYIDPYKKAQPDKQYRKDPDVFLRNRAWEDELIMPIQNENGEKKLVYDGPQHIKDRIRKTPKKNEN